jgi:hypothetical protein
MAVRSVDGEHVRCTWFDGRYWHQATFRRETVRRIESPLPEAWQSG